MNVPPFWRKTLAPYPPRYAWFVTAFACIWICALDIVTVPEFRANSACGLL